MELRIVIFTCISVSMKRSVSAIQKKTPQILNIDKGTRKNFPIEMEQIFRVERY